MRWVQPWARQVIVDAVAGEGAIINPIVLAEVCVGDSQPDQAGNRIHARKGHRLGAFTAPGGHRPRARLRSDGVECAGLEHHGNRFLQVAGREAEVGTDRLPALRNCASQAIGYSGWIPKKFVRRASWVFCAPSID